MTNPKKCDAEGDDDELTAAQAFHDSIKEIADIGQVTGDIILSFEEVHVLTPRGRHDVDMFPDFLRSWGGGDYCGAEHDREEIAKHERLKKSYEDPTSEVIPSISRPLSKRRSSNRALFKAVTANLKAVQSDLFIEKYIFVSEQPVLIELSGIQQAVFSRGLARAPRRGHSISRVSPTANQSTCSSRSTERSWTRWNVLEGEEDPHQRDHARRGCAGGRRV
ncbi:hypothetical protein DFH09DRAFT_354461 [Mycena vulgaris]|nr:hypothetical protein DFH09DRAFT_354461 [Mycena vulgaris]